METRTETPHPAEGQGGASPAGSYRVANDAPEEKRPSRRPPLALILAGAIVLIVIIYFGARYLAYATTHQSTDDALIDSNTYTVTSKISERVDQVRVEAQDPVTKGEVLVVLDSVDERTRYAQAEAAVAAQRAQARAAQENVLVTAEQQRAQNAQGSGGIQAARAQIANAQANYTAQSEEVSAARAAVAQALAQLRVAQAQVPSAREGLNKANADLARTSALVSSGDVAEQQLDADRATQAEAQAQYRAALDQATAAETAVTQSEARLTSAVATANAAQAGIGAQQGQLITAEGRLSESAAEARVPAMEAQANAAQAQARSLEEQARAAREQLGYTVIRSPIDGFVGARDIDPGTTVSPGQALLQLVPSTGHYVTANFKETQIGNMRVGQPVDISVDAYPGVKFEGRLSSLGPASQNEFSLIPPQNATGNFVKVTQRVPIRIDFVNPPPDRPLRVGMSVEASVKVK